MLWLVSIRFFFCIFSINHNDLTQDLLEEELKNVGDSARECSIIRLLRLFDLFAPSKLDWVGATTIPKLKDAKNLELRQVVHVNSLVVPDQCIEHMDKMFFVSGFLYFCD
jgi:hypothetical protein